MQERCWYILALQSSLLDTVRTMKKSTPGIGLLSLLTNALDSAAANAAKASDQDTAEWRRWLIRSAVIELLPLYHEQLEPGKGVTKKKLERFSSQILADLMMQTIESPTRTTKAKVLTAAHRLSKDVVAALAASGVPVVE